MFIPLKMVLIGIDPYPYRNRWFTVFTNGESFHGDLLVITKGVDETELALDYGMELSLPWSWSPQSPQSHLPKSHQKHCTLHKSAEDSWAELELLCSPTEYGSSLITAVPSAKIAATADVVPQICQHSKAALGLLCCPHHRLERPQHAMLLLQSWQISDMGRSTRWWGQHSSPKTTFDLRLLCSPPTARHGATNLLNTVQLILDCCAVTTKVRIAPCHHGSICQNGSKGILCATNLLHVFKLSLDCCPHHSLERPMSPQFHLPRSQQKHCMWHESVERWTAVLSPPHHS